jgi:hypothetical protein
MLCHPRSKAHGFVLHRVRHGVMTMDFVDDLGSVLHSITVPARPEK